MPGLASHSLAGFSIAENAPELHLNRPDDVEKDELELDGACGHRSSRWVPVGAVSGQFLLALHMIHLVLVLSRNRQGRAVQRKRSEVEVIKFRKYTCPSLA